MRKVIIVLAAVVVTAGGCAYNPHAAGKFSRDIRVHVVERGDTLSEIADTYDVTLFSLKKRNRLISDRIDVGQRLYIPIKGSGITGYSPARVANPDREAYSPKRWMPAYKRKQSSGGSASAASSTKSGTRTAYAKPPTRNKRSRRTPPPSGTPSLGMDLDWPLRKPIVTSRFGIRNGEKHDGLDIAGTRGTKIYAAAPGTVMFAGRGPTGYGLVVIVKHNKDVITVYSHNRKNYVNKGDKVDNNTPIAEVGTTGRASGPHVHFEVRVKRVARDPSAYLPRLTEIKSAER